MQNKDDAAGIVIKPKEKPYLFQTVGYPTKVESGFVDMIYNQLKIILSTSSSTWS